MSCSGPCVARFPEIQNHVNGRLVSNRGVHHRLINSAVRPFNIEILLDKLGSLPVDAVNEFFGFLLALAEGQ